MKIRVTILTENDKPLSLIGENPQAKAELAWTLILNMINKCCEDGEKATLESVEVEE